MRPTVFRGSRFFALMAGLPVAATLFSPLSPQSYAIQPRAERVASRIAERRYARVSIAEARVARAEARVAEIAPAVPVPPPPRPATVRRMARAGVPLSGPTPSTMAAAAPASPPPRILAGRRPAQQPGAAGPATASPPLNQAPPATATVVSPGVPATANEPGVWTLDAANGVAPAAAEVAPDGTRSVLAAGGESSPRPPAATPSPSDPAVTQPLIELLPTPGAK